MCCILLVGGVDEESPFIVATMWQQMQTALNVMEPALCSMQFLRLMALIAFMLMSV
jgi:hypothetical protein